MTQSKHFDLQQVTEGTYAAIARMGGWALCNAGLVDLGDEVLVFDTFLTPRAASDLYECILPVTGKPPRFVINSHYHNDHIWGNQVFAPQASIISSAKTRALITTAGKEEYDEYSAGASAQLVRARQRYQDAATDRDREQAAIWLGYFEGLVEELPALRVVIPAITFVDRLDIHGLRDTARLIAFNGAHTGSDAVLYLPEQGVVFMADLLFVQFHPYLGDGDPDRLLAALKEINSWDARCFIPGHGPAGTRDDLLQLIGYIEFCLETAQELASHGQVSAEQINAIHIPDAYAKWGIPQFFRANLQFLCKRCQSADTGSSTAAANQAG